MKNAMQIILGLFILTSAFAQIPDSTLIELPDRRTYHSKTYYRAEDHTYLTRLSAGYIHYRARDGSYKDIDTKLRLDTSGVYYTIDHGLYNVAFTYGIGREYWDMAYEVPKPVHPKFRHPTKPPAPTTRLRWKILSAGYFDPQSRVYQILQNARAVTPVVEGNKISYPETFEGIEVRHACENTRVKEEIVLYHPARANLPDPAPYGIPAAQAYWVVQVEFMLTPNNLKALARVGGGKMNIKPGSRFGFEGEEQIDFEDEEETLHFFFPRDYAYAVADSVTDFSNRVTLRRYFYSDRGKDYMLLGVPWSWMKAAPAGTLILDPTTAVGTNADTRLHDGRIYGSDDKLIVGKYGSGLKRRTIIKFDVSGIPSGATVLSARMKLWYYATGGTPC